MSATGMGAVIRMVDVDPIEGIPKAGVVVGVVVDAPPMVPTKKGVEVTPAMGLVGAV